MKLQNVEKKKNRNGVTKRIESMSLCLLVDSFVSQDYIEQVSVYRRVVLALVLGSGGGDDV